MRAGWYVGVSRKHVFCRPVVSLASHFRDTNYAYNAAAVITPRISDL
jgi:hypothetical protein